MQNIYDHIYDLIGKTPLVRLHTFEKTHGAVAEIVAKLENRNPPTPKRSRIPKVVRPKRELVLRSARPRKCPNFFV